MQSKLIRGLDRMPQFQIQSTPLSTQTINTAMRRSSNSFFSMNDRYPRIFTKTGINSIIRYSNFLNVPGFDLQAGTSINVFNRSGDGANIKVFPANNFPGIAVGDPFSVVVGAAEGWTGNSPVTHHGYFYGSAGTHTLVNGAGDKRWFTRTQYDGGNTVTIDGFYSGAGTAFPFARMYLLALRFGLALTGYAVGDGNSATGGQTGFTIGSYTGTWPQNTTISHTSFAPSPPEPGPEDGNQCFPADAIVTMADGSTKRIDEILVGDQVQGGYGHVNTVLGYHKSRIGHHAIYKINGRHRTSQEHKHYTTAGWAGIDVPTSTMPTNIRIIVDNDLNTAVRHNPKFVNGTPTLKLETGMMLITEQGTELVTSIEQDHTIQPDDLVYTLVTDGSHAHYCNGILVGAWATDTDFDYTTWQSR